VDVQLKVKEPKPEPNSDAWILAKVKSALLFHKNVSGLHTDVDVNNGVVTLRGEAKSRAQKDLTAEYAADVEGVREVRNEITVSEAKAGPPESGREKEGRPAEDTGKGSGRSVRQAIDDASITAMVKLSLLFHRSTSGLRTDVDTNNGVVTVKGRAKNAAEKDLVTKIVEDIEGVKDVRNEMSVGTTG
jgi:osmotically-inducible protein OsmY